MESQSLRTGAQEKKERGCSMPLHLGVRRNGRGEGGTFSLGTEHLSSDPGLHQDTRAKPFSRLRSLTAVPDHRPLPPAPGPAWIVSDSHYWLAVKPTKMPVIYFSFTFHNLLTSKQISDSSCQGLNSSTSRLASEGRSRGSLA